MNDQTTEQPPEVLAREIAADRAYRREQHQALTAIPASNLAEVASRTTFLPQSMGEAMQFADLMAKSNFVPAHLRNRPGDCMAIVMQSARWGMDPFAVANKSYFVKDGAPAAFEAQLINAVVNSSGALDGRLAIDFEGDGEKLRCTVTGFLRADPGQPKVKTQSIARVTVRNSPLWKADPEQQLAYYTTRAWARLHCPEVLLGVYTPDEVDVEPVTRTVSPPIPRRDDVVEEPEYDPVTGEIIDAETVSRQLDSQTYASMGHAVGEEPISEAEADDARAKVAQDIIDEISGRNSDFAVEQVIKRHRQTIDELPEDLSGKVYAAKAIRLKEIAAGS